MIRGSCLCGSVRYEIRGPLGEASHCHCGMCRKAHGAAFGTYAGVNAQDFVLLAGAESIVRYESSPGIVRTFCRGCGSTLQFIVEARPQRFSIALGTLDDDPLVRPACHIFVESKAPWYEIDDNLPRHAADP